MQDQKLQYIISLDLATSNASLRALFNDLLHRLFIVNPEGVGSGGMTRTVSVGVVVIDGWNESSWPIVVDVLCSGPPETGVAVLLVTIAGGGACVFDDPLSPGVDIVALCPGEVDGSLGVVVVVAGGGGGSGDCGSGVLDPETPLVCVASTVGDVGRELEAPSAVK